MTTAGTYIEHEVTFHQPCTTIVLVELLEVVKAERPIV